MSVCRRPILNRKSSMVMIKYNKQSDDEQSTPFNMFLAYFSKSVWSLLIQTRLSQIQEQPWNSNSAHWKTLHTLIFNWIFQLLEYWWPLEALEKSYKNTSPVWMDFKNSFAWLIYMKKLIFDYNNFFGSGYFLTYFFRSDGSKNGRSQKSCCNQKSVFSCQSTTQKNFWNPITLVMYFHNFFPELIMAASIPGIENFSWKSVCEVFFNMQNWNFRVAPESERTGWVLLFDACHAHFPKTLLFQKMP